MMRSLFSGVSGLKGHQTRMDVIGNNIANVNAVGFKSSRVTFADTLSQTTAGASAPGDTIGGTNPKQIGLGTGVASIDLLFTDGSVQSTGKNTDLCLSGNGLFVVKNGNETYYTRDGAFEFDADGNYVLPGSGLFVQGWTGTDGEINTTGAVGNITVKAGKSMAAAKSTSASYENNLNSAVPTITKITGNVLTLSDESTVNVSDGTKYAVGNSMPITTSLNIYDSLGNAHAVMVYFVETDASKNQWKVTVGDDYTDTAAERTQTLKDNTEVKMTDITLKFDTNGKFDTGDGSGTLTLINGSESPMTVELGFSLLTQFAGSNTVKGNANGNAAGTLKSVSIDSSGVITGTYTNGLKQAEAQVAVAQFTNASGLTKTGSSLYQESNNSGTANVKTAADLGVTITPSALEMSNVDIANEFSDMIITQRGFQSNSKIITVGDEMLETVINMKR